MLTIILIGVLGAIISAAIGTFWYSMATPMGRWHMEYIGFTKLSPEEQRAQIEEAKPHMWKSYLGQMILSFLTSFFIGYISMMLLQNIGSAEMVFIFIPFIWLAFTVPNIGSSIIWGNYDRKLAWKLFFSQSLCNLITFLAIALVATLIL